MTVAALAALAAACGSLVVLLRPSHQSHVRVGSGRPVATARALPRFSRVELQGVGSVHIIVGRRTAVTVRGDDNIVPLVRTTVDNGTLVIAEHGSFSTKTPLTVAVSTPRLTGATLAGAGTMRVDGIGAPVFSAALDGFGRLDLAGRATRLDLQIAGSGDAQAGRLVTKDVRVVLSGSGTSRVVATRRLDAVLSGTGSILYGGNPADVHTRVSGMGTIAAA